MSFGNPQWVWMNGQFVPWESATIHVSTHALHYGSGVFEGMRCYQTPEGPALFRLADHVERFYCSAQTHGMEIPYTPEELAEAMAELVVRNNFTECYVRPICYRGSHDLGVIPTKCPVEVGILAWPWAPLHGTESLNRGLRACVSRWKKFHSDMIPATAKASGQYVNSILALHDAAGRGYDEAILLDMKGYLSEAASENIFLVRNGVICTNDEQHPILLGITRDSIIQFATDLGYRVVISAMTVDDLKSADEVFLTGTAAEVVPVCEVDDCKIGAGSCGPITRKIQQQFKSIVTGHDARYLRWLQPVGKASAISG